MLPLLYEQINTVIQSPSLQAHNWALIAQAYAAQGESIRAVKTTQLAVQTAKIILDRFEQLELLWKLFQQMLELGETQLATQLAAEFEVEPYCTVALQQLALHSSCQ